MSDPQIICTNCGTEIKLTESLAAPIVAASRKQFEAQLAAKEADFGRREAHLRQTQEDLAKARETLDEQVAIKMRAERVAIAEAEAKKARLAISKERSQMPCCCVPRATSTILRHGGASSTRSSAAATRAMPSASIRNEWR